LQLPVYASLSEQDLDSIINVIRDPLPLGEGGRSAR